MPGRGTGYRSGSTPSFFYSNELREQHQQTFSIMSTQEKSELYNMFIEVLTPHFDREIEQGNNIISKLDEISNVLKPSEL